jgi:hypothetical protein
VHGIRLLFVSGLLAVAAATAGAVLWAVDMSEDGPRCQRPIPRGATEPAAWDTTALFVTEVVLRHDPACGYDLSTRRLRGGLSRGEWARGAGPVKPFVTRYRPTPVARASRDPNAPEAVYALSRQVRELMRVDANGRWTIPISVGLAAPDAGLSAYRLVLELEDGSWRVDRATPVALHFSDD